MVKSLKIGDIEIGDSKDPFFIAEIGINHNGSIDKAIELIDLCVDAGAQAVKFQKELLKLYTAEKNWKNQEIIHLGKLMVT